VAIISSMSIEDAEPIPASEVPDPPPEGNFGDRDRWTEIVSEHIGRLFVLAYDAEARVAAVYDAVNLEWRIIRDVSPVAASELPDLLITYLAEELEQIHD
jgi:hypothetical protein